MNLPMLGGKIKARTINTGVTPGVGSFGQETIISRDTLNLNTFIPLKLIVTVSGLLPYGTRLRVNIYYDNSLTNPVTVEFSYNTAGSYEVPIIDLALHDIYAIGLQGRIPDLTVSLTVYLVYIGG